MLMQGAATGSQEEQQQFQEYIRQLAEQHGPVDFLSYMSGAMGGGGAMSERYKQLLEQLKSGDEVKIMQATIDFSSELSMAQDTSIPQFTLEQFIQPLVDCLKMQSFPDIIRTPSVLTPDSLLHSLHNSHHRHPSSPLQQAGICQRRGPAVSETGKRRVV